MPNARWPIAVLTAAVLVAVLRHHGTFRWQPALNLGTFGGVYIAGRDCAVLPLFLYRLRLPLAASKTKAASRSYVQDIPVYLIVHDYPGLLGSGAHLRQTLGHIL
ncbi:glucokinase [Shigella flexneri]